MAGLTDIVVANFTKVYYDDTNSGTFTKELNNIQSITHPTDERTIIDVPQYGQIYQRKLVGSSSAGNCELVVNFDPSDASHIALLGLYKSGDSIPWKVEISEGSGSAVNSFYTFNGRVSSKSTGGEFDGIVSLTFSIAVDGAIADWTDAP